MTALRSAWVEIPSNPKPNSSDFGVVIAAPTGKPPASVTSQVLAFAPLPSGGPAICQPPVSPASNEVEPPGQAMSSRNTPRFCVPQSLTYAIEISTVSPAQSSRLIDHCCQPPELPEAAFHSPLVPVGVHVGGSPAVYVW